MTTTTTPRILIFGTGSIGSIYAWLLARAAATAEEAPYDFILVATKAIPGATPPLIAPALGPRRPSSSSKTASPSKPNMRPPFRPTPSSQALSTSPQRRYRRAWSSAAAATIVLFDDVQPRRWAKLLVNVAWNPTCALARLRDVEFLASGGDDARDSVWGTMIEVVDVARACGYDEINEDEAKRQLERATARIGTKGVEPSMLADVWAGRALEVEAIMGNCLRVAREKGVKTPNLAALYVLAKGLDDSLRHAKQQSSARQIG
ncbi:2-dehydropantoate 2-reductase [Phyllosticta citriasiana]|uniref:2-dehydropantoate 2-reductase n=1 Tax=Phyllosticta citriasiana TaxID=595635 RepID=UPI0030FDBC2B